MNLTGKKPLGMKSEKSKRDRKRLARVADLPCVICHEYGMPQLSPTTVHHCIHGRHSTDRAPDSMTIPLCEGHHQGLIDKSKVAIHQGKGAWQQLYGRDTDWLSWVEERLSSRGQKFLVRGICEVDGCEARAKHVGLCGIHYRRKQRYGNPLACARAGWGEPLKWIRENANHTGDDCLLWPFSQGSGYYSVHLGDGKWSKAHRVMCEEAHGAASQGMYALHSCNNKSCVNPRHLRWGTPKENTEDAVKSGSIRRGDKHALAKLTEADVVAIRQRWARGEKIDDIAADYSASRSAIWLAAVGKTWSHI